ncbi:hypothetical protein [Leptothoe spongobia]|uniref:hypothetical protein n=1 Tax=Leptothoe spongobia TaxID=2651728 RepID=UPI001C038ABF|nr:hypothetical protein [Leptothoe spongobia]
MQSSRYKLTLDYFAKIALTKMEMAMMVQNRLSPWLGGGVMGLLGILTEANVCVANVKEALVVTFG